ncbi:MAG: hypothetical protein EZS28_043070, partial [Streblomastix strix]
IFTGNAKISSAEFEELIKNHLPDHPGDYKTVMDCSGVQYKNIIAEIKDICFWIEYYCGTNYGAKLTSYNLENLDSSVKLIRHSDNSRAIGVIKDTMQRRISMAVTVGPGAFTNPLVFILQKECKLPEKVNQIWNEESKDVIQNDFGNQTLDTYDQYADCFIEFINGLRFIQRFIPFAPICLAVDSHSSRSSATTNKKFKQNTIISVIFPPFLTFCMQPADFVINHSLRANFRKNLHAILRQYELTKRTTSLLQEEKVIAMVFVGRDAHQSSTTRIVRENNFRRTSLFPRSHETLLLNKYIQNDLLQPKHPIHRQQSGKLSLVRSQHLMKRLPGQMSAQNDAEFAYFAKRSHQCS